MKDIFVTIKAREGENLTVRCFADEEKAKQYVLSNALKHFNVTDADQSSAEMLDAFRGKLADVDVRDTFEIEGGGTNETDGCFDVWLDYQDELVSWVVRKCPVE